MKLYVDNESLLEIKEFITDKDNIKFYKGYSKSKLKYYVDLTDFMLRETTLRMYIDDLMYDNPDLDRDETILLLRKKLGY